MNRFNERIVRVRFSKILICYLCAVIVFGIVSLAVLGYVFRDKLTFAYNYMLVSEKVEKNNLGVDSLQNDLIALAQKSPDLADILVLDSNNTIVFSAKKSDFAVGNPLRLTRGTSRGYYSFLSDPAYPDYSFWLVKNTELATSSILFSNWYQSPQDHYVGIGQGKPEDDYFFERNFNNKKVYLLSYVGDRATGDKIYFISDIQPVKDGALYARIIGAGAILFFMAYWVLLALWIYADAFRRRLHAPIWGVIGLFTNLAGLLVYQLYKQNNSTCFKCGAVQGRAHIFCTSCGAKLSETCPTCGAVTSAGERFCKSCGDDLPE